jgi:hypothetical protein
LDLDFIHLFDSGSDLWLVGQDIDDENKGVVIFDFLHGRFGSQRVFYGGELIESWCLGGGL